jgi:hypothetical protein
MPKKCQAVAIVSATKICRMPIHPNYLGQNEWLIFWLCKFIYVIVEESCSDWHPEFWIGDNCLHPLQVYKTLCCNNSWFHSFIHFPVVSNLEHRGPFGVSVNTHCRTPLVRPSQRPLTAQENTTYRHETNIRAPNGIRTRDPSNQAAEDLHLRPRAHWDLQ